MVYEYFAQGLDLLRRHGSCPVGLLRQFEAYQGRTFVPSHIEGQLRAMVEGIAVEGLNERIIEGLNGAQATSTNIAPMFDGHDKRVAPVFNPSILQSSNPSHGFWAGLAQKKDLPDEIMALRDRAIELHKRESLVHGQMGVAARAGKQKVAYELAKEIMEEIRPELDGIYDAVRAWEATGKLAVKQMAADSPAAMVMEQMKRLKYCNERVCRINRWLTDGFREKTVKGEKAKVLLDAKDVQELDGERLGLMVEAKTIKEKIGI